MKLLGELDSKMALVRDRITIAAARNRRRFVGIEVESEHVQIAKARMRFLVTIPASEVKKHHPLFHIEVTILDQSVVPLHSGKEITLS